MVDLKLPIVCPTPTFIVKLNFHVGENENTFHASDCLKKLLFVSLVILMNINAYAYFLLESSLHVENVNFGVTERTFTLMIQLLKQMNRDFV